MILPHPRGPLSDAIIERLRGSTLEATVSLPETALLDNDLNLALYVCYELHYEGYESVSPDAEWDPQIISFRNHLEGAFEKALIERVGTIDLDTRDVVDSLLGIIAHDEDRGLTNFLENDASLDQVKEFVTHRSAYQLKEADPHSWVIPRLRGPGKAALVEIQADEYGGGRPDRVHAELFAKMMQGLGLDSTYGAYVDALPGVTLAVVNLVSFFGLHRRTRGAAIGHLVAFESTSSDPNRRYGNALRRLGMSAATTDFFDEHVEADSVHEQIALHDLAGGVAAANPELIADILFGARALLALEKDWADYLLEHWCKGQCSLLSKVSKLTSA